MKHYIAPETKTFQLPIHPLMDGSPYNVNTKDDIGTGNAWTGAAARSGDWDDEDD